MIIKLKHQNPSTPADIGEYTTNQKNTILPCDLKKSSVSIHIHWYVNMEVYQLWSVLTRH